MSVPNRKITPIQLFSVLFLSRLFASMTYIAGLDRDLQPGETVVAMLYSSAFIVISGVGEAVFLKNDSGVGILMRTKSVSNKFFVFTDVFYLVFFLAYCALAAARFNLFVNFSVTSPRMPESFSIFSCCFNRYSFAFSICIALSLFWNCERSF